MSIVLAFYGAILVAFLTLNWQVGAAVCLAVLAATACYAVVDRLAARLERSKEP